MRQWGYMLAGTVAPGAVLVAVSLMPSHGHAPDPPIDALAPAEVVAEGFQEPAGLAVDDTGAVFVSDRQAGTVTRISSDNTRVIFASGLEKPIGLALDHDGRLLIVEALRDRLLRREASGRFTVLASGLEKPAWVAVAPDETVYVSGKGPSGEGIFRLAAGAAPVPVAGAFEGLAGLSIRDGALFAVTERSHDEGEHEGSMLVELQIPPDGAPGPPEILFQSDARDPGGLALDRLGAVFFAAESRHAEADGSDRGVLLKLLPDGRLATFAWGLGRPRAIAFGAKGDLYFVESGDHRGRVLRFRAPSVPAVTVSAVTDQPAVTNQPAVSVTGHAEPGALVAVHRTEDFTAVLASAGTASGAVSLTVPLVTNALNSLAVTATGAGGLGLTSAPAELTVLHDDQPPGVALLRPPAGAFARQLVTVEGRATDGGSGVASLTFTVDGRTVVTLENRGLLQPFAGSLVLDTTAVPDGGHTLTATAADRAGNRSVASRSLIVDNTPPDTEIVDGPADTVGGTVATFTVAGTDNLSPAGSLLVAWRMDGGAFTPFSPATVATMTGLAEGPHLFEVKARDLAGNEDATPARRAFTVGRLRVTITAPPAGATIAAGAVAVRGTVEAGGAEASVVVNGVVAAVHGSAFAALVPVSHETTALAAVATTAAGAATSHTVPIGVSATPVPPPALVASPESGAAPLTVAFSLVAAGVPTSISVDLDGDGAIDFTGPNVEGLTFTYARPGLYVPTATVSDARGNRFLTSAVVQAYEIAALDGSLQAKWAAFRSALRQNDVDDALELLVVTERVGYRELLASLGPRLGQVDAILPDMRFVSLDGDRAEYQMIRVDDGVRLSYLILFAKDEDGIWRLEFF